MAIDEEQVTRVRNTILKVITAEYSPLALESAEKTIRDELADSKEGRHAGPEILKCLQNHHGKRAMKLIGRRSGSYTGAQRIMLAGLSGCIWALLFAGPGLMLLPSSARVAAPMLCQPSTDTPSRRSVLSPLNGQAFEEIDFPKDPFVCPNDKSQTRLSTWTVFGTLMMIYWMPFTLLSYVVLIFSVHRKKKRVV